jgi:hypothetical protein
LVNNLQDVVTERETTLANAELRVAEATKNIPIIDQLIASGNTDPKLVDMRKTIEQKNRELRTLRAQIQGLTVNRYVLLEICHHSLQSSVF